MHVTEDIVWRCVDVGATNMSNWNKPERKTMVKNMTAFLEGKRSLADQEVFR